MPEPCRAAPYIAPPGFWAEVRRACDDHGALLIFDEIPTGLGKTGRLFASEHDAVVPDITVIGKSLGGGMLPLAAVLARAALATLDVIEDEGLVENAPRVRGPTLWPRLGALKARHAVIGDARGRWW